MTIASFVNRCLAMMATAAAAFHFQVFCTLIGTDLDEAYTDATTVVLSHAAATAIFGLNWLLPDILSGGRGHWRNRW